MDSKNEIVRALLTKAKTLELDVMLDRSVRIKSDSIVASDGGAVQVLGMDDLKPNTDAEGSMDFFYDLLSQTWYQAAGVGAPNSSLQECLQKLIPNTNQPPGSQSSQPPGTVSQQYQQLPGTASPRQGLKIFKLPPKQTIRDSYNNMISKLFKKKDIDIITTAKKIREQLEAKQKQNVDAVIAAMTANPPLQNIPDTFKKIKQLYDQLDPLLKTTKKEDLDKQMFLDVTADRCYHIVNHIKELQSLVPRFYAFVNQIHTIELTIEAADPNVDTTNLIEKLNTSIFTIANEFDLEEFQTEFKNYLN